VAWYLDFLTNVDVLNDGSAQTLSSAIGAASL
jgi:hypothetical protein